MTFIIGFITGTFLGVFVMACCAAAGKYDEANDGVNNVRKKDDR